MTQPPPGDRWPTPKAMAHDLIALLSAPIDTPSAALFAHATRETAGGDRPFLLAGNRAWLVAQGHMDVFAVRVRDNLPVGSRRHLVRVAAGGMLVGTGLGADPDIGLLAVGIGGGELWWQSLDVLQEAADTLPRRRELNRLVEGWVEALCTGIAGTGLPPQCDELAVGATHDVSAGVDVRPRDGVGWVRHDQGHSSLLGLDGASVNGVGYTPVGRHAWMRTLEPARITIVDSDAVGDVADLWAGVARLHQLVLRAITHADAQVTFAERERLSRRAAANASALANACGRLVRTLDTGERRRRATVPPEAGRSVDPLLAACRIIGDSLGVTVRVPATARGVATVNDLLAGIARASRLRTRQVVLRGAWWTTDSGPLLALHGETGAPLALVPNGRGYTMRDPRTGATTPLSAAVAATLAPVAHTFYRPFSDSALTALDVARFGLRGCGRDFARVIAMASAAALLGMVPAIATGLLFNNVIPGAQRSQLLQIMMLLVAAALSTALFQASRAIALLRIETRMGSAVQAAVWDRLLGLPMPFFRPYAAGDLAVRAMGIDGIRQVLSGTTITAIFSGLFSITSMGLMFFYSPLLALQALLLIFVAVAISAVGACLQMRPQRRVSELAARTSGLVLQLLSSIGKLRVAGAEPRAFAVWAARFSEQRFQQVRARAIGNWVAVFNATFPILANVALFWRARALLAAGDMRTGDFLAFLMAFTTASATLLAMTNALLGSLSVLPLFEQARPILETRPEADPSKADPGTLTGRIELQHITFRYVADGTMVLRDLTLQVEPGEFIAFVGPSGSGKSTILRLLLGFEAAEGGAIYYDGQELGGLDIQAVRRQIGVVLQNGRLRSGDILTNIVGSASATQEDAWAAAELAGFADDVRAMPMGMHTVVSEGGGTLSGGQRQRLMIARALMNRPRLVYFDEATSALDNRTQGIVGASLDRMQATRIVVAHRLSTIVNADRICVVERGSIVESGRYEELMARKGPFAELAKRQLV